MDRNRIKTAVLWTGGKDSCLALHRANEAGLDILRLVTFVPEGDQDFKAHSLKEMAAQALALGLPHDLIPIKEPYRESYTQALKRLKSERAISAVVTGDIDLVAGLPNWISECCRGLGIQVIMPLWQVSRESLMDELLARKIAARITWINHPSIPTDWLHQTIDAELLRKMKDLAVEKGIDLCGENGEYHTMVTSAPLFKQPE